MVVVVLADPLDPIAVELLKYNRFTVIDKSKDRGNLVDAMQGADAVIVRSATKVNKEFIEQSPNLKIVGRAGVGLDNVDIGECKNREIQVVNSPEGPTQSVAELTLGLMIAASRKLIFMNSGTRNGDWPKKTKGTELSGKTLGIIGSGAIGGTLAKYCIALGMKVIAYDIVHLPELSELAHFQYQDLDQVISTADYISLHVPLVPATKHMLNDETFAKMKDGVIIVNAARGGVIDELALSRALQNGKVSAAAIDVYENEPIDPNHPLMSNSNVILTPHIGAQTIEAGKKNATIVCQKIIDHFKTV